MKKLILIFLSLSISLISLSADNDWYISPMGAYVKTDQSRLRTAGVVEDDNGFEALFAIGKEVTNNFNLELGVGNKWVNSDDELSQLSAELNTLFFLNRNANFAPYLSAGVGILDTVDTPLQSGDTNPSWGAGIGFISNVGFFDRAKLRAEARFQQEVDNSEWAHDDVLVRLGFYVPLGAEEKPMPKMEPKDSDGDGVMDADDKCPATPAGVKVNSFGCELDSDGDGVVDSKDQCPNTPAGTAVNSRGCKVVLDSDGDGVNDDADRCPNTPAGTAVNSLGCAVDPDDDNDGVPNSKDQCPNTAAGVRVDFKGCEIKEVITLPGINFELNSAQLTASSLSILDGAASTLNTYTDINAEVAGHTDSTGSAAYNKGLSDRRAASVKDYLVSKGVSPSRLTSRGYGEEQPIADNSTKAGRAQNRRVELRVNK